MFLGSHPGTIDARGTSSICYTIAMFLILQTLLEFSQLMKYEEVLE